MLIHRTDSSERHANGGDRGHWIGRPLLAYDYADVRTAVRFITE